ncbi:MAG: hypothetical protein QJR03_13980 [Sphaerobacter sp.]|nr:hypothetical protein [Sphaerobacter sp.]
MGASEPTVVQITSGTDLDDLLARLPEFAESRVTLAVPEDCPVLSTAAELSRVLAAARRSNVTVALSTQDRLRQELARMLGWPVVSPPPTQPVDPDTTVDLASYVPTVIPPQGAAPAPSARPTATGTIVVDPEAEPPPAWLATASHRAHGGAPGQPPPAVEPDERPPRRRPFALIFAILAPLVVLLLIGSLLYYVLPTATVTLVPEEHRIAAALTYGVSAPGASYDIALEPTVVENTTVFDRTIPTTGERFEPDGTATGSVQFMNPSTKPIAVPSQTRLTGANGMVYLTREAVTVPGADPFGSLALGTAAVTVVAAEPGPAGNTDAGTLVGQLDNGLYFANREPIKGGTTKRIATVSEADLAALKQAAEADLAARAEAEFQQEIDPAHKLVPGSIQKDPPVIQFSHQVGQDAESVSVHATQTVRGKVYDPAQLDARARDEIGRRLAAQAGNGVMLLGPTVTVSEPTPLNADQTAFRVHAEAVVRTVITDEQRQALAEQLAGKSMEEAERIVAAVPGVASYRLEQGPSWLPRRMPQIPSHIRVELASGKQPGSGS